jgi:hypothetical protein
MAEYKSFHYLMHKQPEHVKAFYVEGPKSLTFAELYSPRTEQQQAVISKSEKSYWRTRDRIEFTIYEDRKTKLVIITCWSVESIESFRTIFVDLERLYHEVESKARGCRDLLTKKKDKKLSEDADVRKAASEFLLARLNIKQEPLPWPAFVADEVPAAGAIAAAPSAVDIAVPAVTGSDSADTEPFVLPDLMERMCTLDRMANDEYEYLEIPCPFDVVPGAPPPPELAAIERLKLCSNAAVRAAAGVPLTSAPAVTEAVTATSPIKLPGSAAAGAPVKEAAAGAAPPVTAVAAVNAGTTAAAVITAVTTAVTTGTVVKAGTTAVGGKAQLNSPANPPAKTKGRPTAGAVPAPAAAVKKGSKKVAPT